jgi:hypothetical protein
MASIHVFPRDFTWLEAVCLSVPPGECGGIPPETERECQCLMDATVTWIIKGG